MSKHPQKPQQSAVDECKRKLLCFALLRAAYEGKTDTVIQMLDSGVPVDIANQTGLQAIHFSAKTSNVELAEELLKRGAAVNAQTVKGNTPLHVASLMGHTEVVKLLLRHGADVNARSDCYGDFFTPLYMGAQIGNQEIVTLLLAHGADPYQTTTNGSTPRHIAQQQGHQVVAEILSEYEKRLLDNSGKNGAGIVGKDANGAGVGPEVDGVCGVAGDSSTEDGDEEGAEGGAGVALPRRKLGPPPVCQDVTSSPRNSPKHFPRKGSPSEAAAAALASPTSMSPPPPEGVAKGAGSPSSSSATQSNGEASS